MDSLPASIDVTQLLPLPKPKLKDILAALYSSRCTGHGHSPDPSVAFALWRSLTFLLGLGLAPKLTFETAARALGTAKVGRISTGGCVEWVGVRLAQVQRHCGSAGTCWLHLRCKHARK